MVLESQQPRSASWSRKRTCPPNLRQTRLDARHGTSRLSEVTLAGSSTQPSLSSSRRALSEALVWVALSPAGSASVSVLKHVPAATVKGTLTAFLMAILRRSVTGIDNTSACSRAQRAGRVLARFVDVLVRFGPVRTGQGLKRKRQANHRSERCDCR
jgi:hypothetical protein